MSRQFDEYMSDKFELNGTMYQMVEPDSFDELMNCLLYTSYRKVHIYRNIFQ